MRIGYLGVQPGRMIDQYASGPATMHSDRSSTKETDACSRPVKHALPAAAELLRFRDHRNCPQHHRPRFGGPPVRGGAMQRAGSPQGGGQKPAIETQPGILDALNEPVEPSIRGDPEAALRWVSRTSASLRGSWPSGASSPVRSWSAGLLKRLNFSLQANCKTREGANHPDRNAQFEHINAR